MMPTALCNSASPQPLRDVIRFANPVVRRLGWLLLLVIPLLLPPVVCAQSQAEIVDASPVVVNGMVRFHVVGVSAYPAQRRARNIAKRIKVLAQDPKFDPKTLRLKDTGSYHQILAGENGEAILAVQDADAQFEGIPRSVLAETLRRSIAESIADYRHDHKSAAIARNAGYALGSMVLLAVLLLVEAMREETVRSRNRWVQRNSSAALRIAARVRSALPIVGAVVGFTRRYEECLSICDILSFIHNIASFTMRAGTYVRQVDPYLPVTSSSTSPSRSIENRMLRRSVETATQSRPLLLVQELASPALMSGISRSKRP